jgi:peptidoglycan/LPS O-acetylase OafA/YrhL
MKAPGFPYRPHIDGLRGLSIALVLAFHLFPTLAPGGFVGVDVFFVISGFLITSLLIRSASEAGTGAILFDFYLRRGRRLFPSLSLVLAATLAAGYVLLLPSELARLADQTLASAGFVQNLVLASGSGYFHADARTTPLLHLWSLGIEEQFYLLWPIIILIAVRLRIPTAAVAAYLGTFSLGWCLFRPETANAGAFFLPQMRMWEILLGATAADFGGFGAVESTESKRQRARLSNAALVLGVALILASVYLPSSAIAPPNLATLLPTFGAALVVTFVPTSRLLLSLLARGPLAVLGRISYPLYLWHWPLYSFAIIAGGGEPSTLARLLILGASVVLAGLTHALVEDPVRRRAGRTQIAAIVLPLIGVSSLALIVRECRGLPERYPAYITRLSEYHYDSSAPMRLGTYFVMGDRDESSFRNDPEEALANKPLVYLWGDSHAASLYAGLNHVFGNRYAIIQRTAARTPPFLPNQFNPGNARRISQFVIDSIRQRKPRTVILDADWQLYDWQPVAETIEALKQAGVANVIVVGPVPRWTGSLPQQLFNAIRLHKNEPIPFHLDRGFDPQTEGVGMALKQLVTSKGATYVDALKIFRRNEGYLIRSGDGPDQLFTFDSSHLTVAGATSLAEHVPLP